MVISIGVMYLGRAHEHIFPRPIGPFDQQVHNTRKCTRRTQTVRRFVLFLLLLPFSFLLNLTSPS